MKIFREYLIVRVPSVFIEETRYKGVDGKTILMSVLDRPERHVRNYGEVTSVPDELLSLPVASDYIGAPGYHDYPVYTWKTNEDIVMEIQIGDKVYFHHNCLLPDVNGGLQWNRNHIVSKKDESGKMWHYFMVKYSEVFASVRYEPLNRAANAWNWDKESELKEMHITNSEKEKETLYYYTDLQGFDHQYRKKVVMIGSYVFVEPDMETWDDISIPTPVTIDGKVLLGTDGQPQMKPRDQWLVTKSMPGEKYLTGWIRHTGTPLKGDNAFLEPGMYVHFQRFTNTTIRFEGVDYFRMRQRHIFGIAHYKPKSTYETV